MFVDDGIVLTDSRSRSVDCCSYGGAFVECSLPHPSEVEIVQLLFRINEVKADIVSIEINTLHLFAARRVH